MILWLMLGCGAEDRAVAEMERALQATNDGLTAALVAHELLRHVDRQLGGTRHGTSIGCPAQEQTGPDASHVLLLDYPPTGCVASSLLPPRVAGHFWLDVTGDTAALARTDSASVGEEPVSGEVGGTVTPTGSGLELTLDGPLTVGAVDVKLDLDVQVEDFGAMTLDGVVRTLGGTLKLDGVVLPPEGTQGNCPVPSEGKGRWTRDDLEVELAFGGTTVPLTSGRFTGDGTLCRYAVPYWPR